MQQPWCANCRIELPLETSSNATERLTEFVSYHEGYEVKVTISEAILTVFEGGIRASHVNLPVSKSVEMCSQCTAVLAELYRFYVEFMKLSREASYMQELLRSSMLWNFGGDVDAALVERDSKPPRFVLRKKGVGTGDDDGEMGEIAPDIVPKVQIHAEEEEPDENETPTAMEEDAEGAGPPKKSKTSPPPKFPCKICDKVFTRRSDTQRHVRTVHEKIEDAEATEKGEDVEGEDPEVEEEEEIELDDEDRFLREAKKYAAEADTGNKSQVFKCDQCDKTYRRKDYLKAHEKSHMSPEERKKELAQRRAIERLHSRSKARKPRKPVPKTKIKKPTNGRKSARTYRCTECDQCFPTRETMKYHRRKLHPKNSFPCSGCDRIFHSENELKIHENVKHGVGEKLADRVCPVPGCGKYFALPNIMKRHVQSVHCEEKDRIFACPFCPLRFPIKNRLDTHLKNRHNSDNSLQSLRCSHPDCDRVYETRSGLQQHIETVHTNLKVHTCDICGRTSIRPEWLRKHMELHDSNREKKHACPTCEMKFYRVASLKKHMKNHSGAKNYLCSECGDKFRQTSSLRRHIEAKHSMKNGPFTCDQCGKAFKIKEYLAQHLRAKSHGGRGHGLYTPAGKRRLERERAQQQQLQMECQVVDVSVSESLIPGKTEPAESQTQRQPPPLLQSQPQQQPQLLQQQQQQHLIIPEGARLVLIDGQHHLIRQSGAPQPVNVVELVITNADADSGLDPQTSTLASGSSTSAVAVPISSSSACVPPAPFQQTPLQFLTTVNPAWFQHHSITQIPQHVAAAAAAAASTAQTQTTAANVSANANPNSNASSQFF